ncbi:MAG: lipoyl(octanoyl) transferase [Rhodocyclaceae bacterium]|nr:MAG: lipoyl(octanoyl) transferase [Rhodocyclaceae bacterium]TND04681.1 MAG: lipoyl(octanoyl) transferase [Rhodocyclaceae bacterium]
MIVRHLGRVDYAATFAAMQEFTAARDEDTPDELWICEHPPVFTQGLSGKPEHLLKDIGIPVVQIDRGGQITYHGPGQVVAYLLLDLRRRELTVRGLVNRIEQAVIDLLAGYGLTAARLAGAPGVYVGKAKIAALGLRIKHGCSYHGVSLNVDMDLGPYSAINPCGYEGMAVTQLRDLAAEWDTAKVGEALAQHLARQLDEK